MANKGGLSRLRAGTVINNTSKKQEQVLIRALRRVEAETATKFSVRLAWRPKWMLIDIVESLATTFPEVDFNRPLPTSSMKPDGGILSILDKAEKAHPILIAKRRIRVRTID